jgi:hypothetical protein
MVSDNYANSRTARSWSHGLAGQLALVAGDAADTGYPGKSWTAGGNYLVFSVCKAILTH